MRTASSQPGSGTAASIDEKLAGNASTCPVLFAEATSSLFDRSPATTKGKSSPSSRYTATLGLDPSLIAWERSLAPSMIPTDAMTARLVANTTTTSRAALPGLRAK